MTDPMVIQGIGIIALLANLSVFQTNTRNNMLLLGLCTCLLWATHFYLLGAITGMAMNIVAAIRFYVYYRLGPTRQNFWIIWAFIILTALATAVTWRGFVSLLPFAGTVSVIIAFWQKDTKSIRRLALLSAPPWIVYAIIVGSYPGIVAETLLLGSNFIGQYRFDLKTFFRTKVIES